MTKYIVRSKKNPKLILCTDGEFHYENYVGPNGYCAKLYKTKGGAERSCNAKPVIVEAIDVPSA